MPNFFEEVDSTGIVEQHIKAALALQNDEAKTIMKRYREERLNLIDQISRYPRGTFTRQHLTGVLAQVEGAITAINKNLAGETVQSAQKSAIQGVNGLLKEMRTFDEKFTGAVTPINLNAALVAADTSNLLVARYKTNLDKYGKNLYAEISNGLFSAALGETSYDEVVGRISNYFTGKEWELHRIVRTELHHVFNVARLKGMQELDDEDFPDLMKTLMHPMDSRTGDDSKYAARLHLVAKVDEPFKYKWDGAYREFMAPPDRPNDRAIMVPYRQEWGKDRGDAFIPMTG